MLPDEEQENVMRDIEMKLGGNLVMVRRWADFTSKYGIGYKLSNNIYGVQFNDQSILEYCSFTYQMSYLDTDKNLT
jgi:POLO box duplicated region